MNLLLRHNQADINIQDASKYTPLHIALIKHDISIYEIILEQGSGREISSDNIKIAWGLMMSAGVSFILRILRFVGKLVKHPPMLDGQNSLLPPLAVYRQGLLEMAHAGSQSPKITENDLDSCWPSIVRLLSPLPPQSRAQSPLRREGLLYIPLTQNPRCDVQGRRERGGSPSWHTRSRPGPPRRGRRVCAPPGSGLQRITSRPISPWSLRH